MSMFKIQIYSKMTKKKKKEEIDTTYSMRDILENLKAAS